MVNVPVAGSYICGWTSIPRKSCSFLIDPLKKGLLQCSDQHLKHQVHREFSLTSSRKYTQACALADLNKPVDEDLGVLA